MSNFPRNLFEFGQMFHEEGACVDYLLSTRFPDQFVCPECGGKKAYWLPDRYAFKCAKCDTWTYLLAGTVMENTKMPICTWFMGAYLMVTHVPGISALQFQRQAGIRTYETAFQMLHKLRAAMVRPERGRLSGAVEVDETYVGGEKEGKPGRGAFGKVIVVGAVEVVRQHAGRARLKVVPDASEESLAGFVKDNVEEGSKVITDGWFSYQNLDVYGYRHVVIEGEDGAEVASEMKHIHRVFGNLKTWLIGTHHGVSGKHLPAYLNEYVFRFNRRLNPMLAFNTILGLAVHAQAPTYEELYAVGEEGGWVHPNPQGEDDDD